MPATDKEPFKLINELEGNYGDRCSGCGHSRAHHLVNPLALNIYATDDCTFQQCSLPLDIDTHPKHTEGKCLIMACGDKWQHGQ